VPQLHHHKPVLTVTYDRESDIADNLGEAQYYFELQLGDDKVIERAVINDDDVLPKKTCDDATEAQPVIEIRSSESSSIVAEGNCIKVNALDAYDLYQQTERIIYASLGVIE